MLRYVVRNVEARDLADLMDLAKVLNTVNLPNHEESLKRIVEHAIASFAGLKNPFERAYLFVLEDLLLKKIIGTSQIIAQHGTREEPHIFFEVGSAEHYSSTIDRLFKHPTLRLGYNYDGPTEVGGLVVSPKYRKAPERLGKQLSLVRFLFIGMNRTAFRDQLLAELLPPLPLGQSLLWEALGRRLTGLSYQEADLISKSNKEFIKALFPEGRIYTCLFDSAVQEVIGAVGKSSLAACEMLKSIGFEYQHRVDPFDGGPHYVAETDAVLPVAASRWLTLQVTHAPLYQPEWLLLSTQENMFQDKARFRAGLVLGKVEGDSLRLPSEAASSLGLFQGDQVFAYRLTDSLAASRGQLPDQHPAF